MKDAALMDITLHDSGSQFKEDLALIRGNTQADSTARRQNSITMNNSDNDSGADTSVLAEDTGSDSETDDIKEEFGEIVNFDDNDSSGSDIMQVEQNSQISSESELDSQSNKRVLKGNTTKINNNYVLNSDESEATTEHFISKESNLKRKRNETETCLISHTESCNSKQLLAHKRKFRKCELNEREKCGELKENHNRHNESKNVKLMKNLRMTKKQKHESVSMRYKDDEEMACNVDGGDGDVDSSCEKDAGDTAESQKDSGEVEDYWEDIYGRTRDKEGNIIQVRIIHSKHEASIAVYSLFASLYLHSKGEWKFCQFMETKVTIL
jgi:hypothetical protein